MILRSVLAGRTSLLGARWGRMPSIKHALVRCAAGKNDQEDQKEDQKEDPSNGAAGARSAPEHPASSSAPASAPPPRPIPRGMKLERVERLGEASWGGVAKVDKTSLGPTVGLPQRIILATGDVTALAVFAAIGRASHHEALSVLDALGTAAPFIVGWVSASTLLGGYSRRAVETPLKTAGLAWITGIPAGLLVRSLLRGHLPETTFVAISMAFTGIFLIGWRRAYAKYLAGDAGAKARSNRRGNPLEFLSLLASLTKRW